MSPVDSSMPAARTTSSIDHKHRTQRAASSIREKNESAQPDSASSSGTLMPARTRPRTSSAAEATYPPVQDDEALHLFDERQRLHERPLQTLARHGVPLMQHAYHHARWAAVLGVKGADAAWQHAVQPRLRAACVHGTHAVLPALQEQGRTLYGRGIHQVGLSSGTWSYPLPFAGMRGVEFDHAWYAGAHERYERSALAGGDWVVPD